MEFVVTVAGVIRVSFGLARWGDNGSGKAQIYRNGVALGILRTASSYPAYTTFTEDLGFSFGDKIQLCCQTGGTGILVNNFNLYFDVQAVAVNTIATKT